VSLANIRQTQYKIEDRRLASNSLKTPRSIISWVVPAVIFLVLAALTLVVWRQQIGHQRSLLLRHTEDVCLQASRRLELHLTYRLAAARILARRWASHERALPTGASAGGEHSELADFSRSRFHDFAAIVMEELPGYHRLRLIPPDMSAGWTVTGGSRTDGQPLVPWERRLFEAARRQPGVLVSEPIRVASGQLLVYAVQPILRGQRYLGLLVAEFEVGPLVESAFQQQIRAEFNFTVNDGDTPLFKYTPDGDAPGGSVLATQRFPIRTRTWEVAMSPRRVQLAGWRASLSVPLLGLVLSTTLAFLVYLLSRRMELFRAARDRALSENLERERAQQALAASEACYRSVFDSATDGLLIIDHGGQVVEANRAAAEMHGYAVEELKGVPVTQLIAPPNRHQYQEFIDQLARGGPVRLESVDLRKDGSSLDVEVRGTEFRYGAERRYLAIVSDVSERRRASQRQATLSRKVLMAQEEERARIARDLHDELGQLLTAVRFELEWLKKHASCVAADAPGGFATSMELVEKAAAELRRICKGLRPPLLDDLGLDPAVRLLVEEFQERTGIAADLRVELGEARISQEIALCTYRIVQESLTNVSRHANAHRVSVQVTSGPGGVEASVADDGHGFDPADPAHGNGSGMTGMRERANLVNGTLTITTGPERGTRVAFQVPLGAVAGKERS